MLFNVANAEDVRCAVVGHVEVVEFARIERVPRRGEIADAKETWTQAAGGGGVAVRELQRLARDVTFFTALGDDELGHAAEVELRALGIRVECVYRDAPQRRCFVYLDDGGERTITTIGAKLVPHAADPLPWAALGEIDGVYFCGGDAGAVREARRARALVATARELATLREAAVRLDALVHSAEDDAERYAAGDLDPPPDLVVTTEGAAGGRYVSSAGEGRWEAAPLPGPLVDSYGAGDSFAAALAYALGKGLPLGEEVQLAAASGAAALTRRGAGY